MLFRSLEAAAIRQPGQALILPDIVTREDWLDRMRAALPDAPPLLSRLARERSLAHAAHAAAARRMVGGSPFELRPGLIAAMLDLYDELKRRQQSVRRFTGDGEAGVVSIDWDAKTSGGEEIASGVYFARLKVDSFTATKKMVLLK